MGATPERTLPPTESVAEAAEGTAVVLIRVARKNIARYLSEPQGVTEGQLNSAAAADCCWSVVGSCVHLGALAARRGRGREGFSYWLAEAMSWIEEYRRICREFGVRWGLSEPLIYSQPLDAGPWLLAELEVGYLLDRRLPPWLRHWSAEEAERTITDSPFRKGSDFMVLGELLHALRAILLGEAALADVVAEAGTRAWAGHKSERGLVRYVHSVAGSAKAALSGDRVTFTEALRVQLDAYERAARTMPPTFPWVVPGAGGPRVRDLSLDLPGLVILRAAPNVAAAWQEESPYLPRELWA